MKLVKAIVAKALAFRKGMNFLMLVLGFGLGNGSLFLAISWLYWSKQFNLIASFGVAYSTITLLMVLCECGGNTLLGRETTAESVSDDFTRRRYSAVVLLRLSVASLIVVSALSIWAFAGSFEFGFLAAGSFGLLVYAFSPTGLLDLNGKAGISGITQAFPVLATAVALACNPQTSESVKGLALGVAFTCGHIGATIIQIFALRPEWRFSTGRLSAGEVYSVARMALPALLMQLPGQLLYRLQIYLGTAFLTKPDLALFIYIRQIIGVGYAFVTFSVRVDMRDFATAAHRQDTDLLKLSITSFSARLSLVISLIGVGASGIIAFMKLEPFAMLALYAPCVFSLCISWNLQRGFLIRRRENPMLVVQAISVSAASIFIFLALRVGGVPILIFAEFASHLAQISSLALLSHRSHHRIAQVPARDP